MPSGDIVVKVSTAERLIPVEGAKVIIVKRNKDSKDTVLAMRNSGRSGMTMAVTIIAPEIALSRQPGKIKPFTSVDIRVEHPNYYPVYITGAQVFADTKSVQNVVLIPQALPKRNITENVYIIPQNL